MSAAKIGCSSDEVAISGGGYEPSPESLRPNETWTATCRGRSYTCSRINFAKGTDVSCVEIGGEQVAASNGPPMPTEWRWVDVDGAAFQTPTDWKVPEKSPTSSDPPTWYAPFGTRAVTLRVRAFSGSLEEQVSALGDRAVEELRIDGTPATLAYGYYDGGHVTTLLVARGERLYDLSCYDAQIKEQSAQCTDILASFTLEPKKKKSKPKSSH